VDVDGIGLPTPFLRPALPETPTWLSPAVLKQFSTKVIYLAARNYMNTRTANFSWFGTRSNPSKESRSAWRPLDEA
jgi:hypothetical protein